ncbi:prolipoprotein diacylglyceryl transferase [Gloeobacter kilaueensis]|uniref:Phosphatidylglycerol--prolipoprotein diacylglyceryl transferase n=1 Tax=Gloeobacter kilaueensis (strain ATCC BAA-2537 / CCAP 1431/1 / ULC 316 / JS1) TaxID=1183438 RepID=U5QG67_GLOK1|nr:prolipoprotein diacylglyceryl transferase [Gloeobacter kilaueensis]AGY56670.1 prolipoprotein diacylglyceryl transferase [Gloeobacter kilaueensis JS1]
MFTSPGPILVQIGGFAVRWYSLLILTGIVAGTLVAQRLAPKRSVNPEVFSDLVVWLVVGAIPMARLYYVIFEWHRFAAEPWWKVFAIWEGGIAIHGGILGGLLAAWLFCRRYGYSLLTLMDLVAPGLILGQAIGRWGNFFNSEAFGAPTDLPWKLFIPEPNRPPGLGEFAFYHPTFLYESLWDLGVFVLLLFVFYRVRPLATGSIACIYAIAYSLGRFWIEGLRMDSLMVGPLRTAQLVSLLGIAAGSIGLWWLNRRRDAQVGEVSQN